MTTFSQLVDKITIETRRPDMKAEVATYLNQTIRELHFEPDKGNIVFFDENRVEAQVTAISDSPLVWNIPNPQTFQAMLDVMYASVWDSGRHNVHPPLLSPGRGLSGREYFYYRVGGSFVFKGFGGTNGIVNLCYYEFPRRLQYFASGARPCEWDDNAGWSYDPAFDVSDETRLAAQNFCTNWILNRWEDVVSEGLRAKIYKRLSDDNRARTCYSMYTQLRQGLVTSESSQLGNYGA